MATTTLLDTKLERGFRILDANGSGRLQEADLTTVADRLATAFATSDAKVAKLKRTLAAIWTNDLRPMDADGDAEVDQNEFRDGIQRSLATDRDGFVQRFTAMAVAWLDIADTNNSGGLDKAEFVRMYVQTLGVSPEQLDAGFRKLDVDGDGQLSRDEIATAATQYWTSDDPEAPGNWIYGPLTT